MAWGLSDLVRLLDRWDVWKQMRANAEKVPELERRIGDLEARLERAPGDACPSCGALEFRTDKAVPAQGTFGKMGMIKRHLKCGACGHTEIRTETP